VSRLFRAAIGAAALSAALIAAPAALAATATAPGGLTLWASSPDPVLAGARAQDGGRMADPIRPLWHLRRSGEQREAAPDASGPGAAGDEVSSSASHYPRERLLFEDRSTDEESISA
jgi:hypothetical protein